MRCVSQSGLTDGQLLAYLDDEAGPDVARHLTACAGCRQRARGLARLLGRVTAALYRIDCPASDELGEYKLGLLPQPHAAAVSTHLRECPLCGAEVARLQDFLANTAPDLELSIAERARLVIARLIGGGNTPGPALALGGLRGADDVPLVFEAGDLQITLTVEASERARERQHLFGLVIGADLANARVSLWQDTRLAGETTIDQGGNFVIADLQPSTYSLVIDGPELEVHLQDVRV